MRAQDAVLSHRQISRIGRTVLGALEDPDQSSVALEIRLQGNSVVISDFAIFLTFLDRSIGQISHGNLQSYGLRRSSLARIDEIRSGSVVLEIVEQLASLRGVALVAVAIAIKSIPDLIKALPEGLKSLAEAFKSYEEGQETRLRNQETRRVLQGTETLPTPSSTSRTLLPNPLEPVEAVPLHDLLKDFNEKRLRKARKIIRSKFKDVAGFDQLSDKDKKRLVDCVLIVIAVNRDNLPKALHFLEDQLESVRLELRPNDY